MTRTPTPVYAWCTGERRSLTARIGDHRERSFTRTPDAYTCSDQGKRTGVRPPRTPATQKPPLTRENAGRSPVPPFGADPKGVRPRSALGSEVYDPSEREVHYVVYGQVYATTANPQEDQ